MFVTFFVWKCFGLFSILILNFKDFFFFTFFMQIFYKKNKACLPIDRLNIEDVFVK